MPMSESKSINMIEGSPSKALIVFSVPLILSNLFQQLYNTMDTIIVGKFNGNEALASIGVSFAVTMVLIAFATGTGIGCSVLISRLYGAGDRSGVKTAASTILIFSAAFSLLLGIMGYVCSTPLLVALQTPANILNSASGYLKIYSCGMPFLFLYNVQSSIFNALGDSKTPLKLLILSSMLNIALDLLFVGKFGLGVNGAAWATLIAQGFSAMVSLSILIHRLYFSEQKSLRFTLFSIHTLRQMSGYAASSVIQQSIVSIGMLLVQSVVNRFGAEVLAGYTAASKIDAFAIMPFIACGNAMSTFTAQNIGAGRPERVRQGYRASLLLCTAISAAELVIILLFKNQFLALFLDNEAASSIAYETGLLYLTSLAFCYILMGVRSSFDGMLRGMGMLKIFLAGNLLNLAFRVAFSFVMAPVIGVSAVWLSMPVGWLINFLFGITAKRICDKKITVFNK